MRLFLFTIGFSFFASASTAYACPDGASAKLVKMDPISSHYVKEVVKRATEGIDTANKSKESPYLEYFFGNWLTELIASVASVVDTATRVAEEERGLLSHSACLSADLEIIEAKMEEVRCELHEALDAGTVNPGKIFALQDLMLFLHERYRTLLRGALDPTIEDIGIHKNYRFDDATDVWCAILTNESGGKNQTCERMSEEECWAQGGSNVTYRNERACKHALLGIEPDEKDTSDKICPFHSNYLPPTVYGYGCDTDAMKKVQSVKSVEAEYKALEALMKSRETFITESEQMKDVAITLHSLTGQPVPDLSDFGTGVSRKHEEMFGCIDDLLDESASDSRREEINIIYRKGGTKWVPRGPFSVKKEESILMPEYFGLRTSWGEKRNQADYLKLPEEFKQEENKEESRLSQLGLSILPALIKEKARAYMKDWSRTQAKRESTVVAKTTDSPLRIAQSFSEIRKASKRLTEIAFSKEEGARLFDIQYGYFIRRSCMFRPCNSKLDRMLKLVFEDTCFPYANGEYKENPTIHQECESAAK